MKKALFVLIGTLTIGATLPAVAGPDWQLIEQGRKAKLVKLKKERAAQAQTLQSIEPSNSQQADKDKHMKKTMKECADMMERK
jgi:hypothetical protein